MISTLRERRCWIFDMDGTLTVAVHDFEAIRADLGLPAGQTILETLAGMSEAEATPVRERLAAIELELARTATVMDGAARLLETLRDRGDRVGILTRNNDRNTGETLRAAGLDSFFESADVLTRDDAAPKPSAEGIHRLLDRWGASPEQAVMTGDFLFDLQAGRAAGAATVYIDVTRQFEHGEHADVMIGTLHELTDELDPSRTSPG